MSIPNYGQPDSSAPWGDAESSIARVRAQMGETIERAERAKALKGQIDAVRGASSSKDDEVSVEVDATGRLLGITFSRAAANLAPTDLSREVMRAVAVAQRKAGDEAIALTAEIFGEDSATVALLRGEVDERMPVEPSDDTLGYRS